MRFGFAALLGFIVAACAPAQLSNASAQRLPAFAVMEDGFRAEFSVAARSMPSGLSISERIPWLANLAEPIAARHYTDWSVVRAETARRLALLEPIDLSAYAGRAPTHTLSALGADREMAAVLLGGTPARRAALRNFDPVTVAVRLTYALLPQVMEHTEDFANFNFKLQFAPLQVRSGRWGAHAAFAVLAGDWLVIVPYALDQTGMIDAAYAAIVAYDNGPPREATAPAMEAAPAPEEAAPAP